MLNEKNETTDIKDKHKGSMTGVDTGLIAMFLKMSSEERLMSNDNAANTILELRNAFKQK